MMRTWKWPMFFAAWGVALAIMEFVAGLPVQAVVMLVVFVLLGGLYSPLMFPRSIGAAEARRRSAADGRPIVYWRPACKYCMRLRFRLGRGTRGLHWVNIWNDPEGAAVVRAANNGDETVPTVVMAGVPHVNPDPAWLRAQL